MYKYGTYTTLEELRPGDLFIEKGDHDVFEVIGPYTENPSLPVNATRIKKIGNMLRGPYSGRECENIFFDSPEYRLCLIKIIPEVDKQFKSPS